MKFRATEEEQGIIDEAKKNGTYMKAPNGQPTNLNEKAVGASSHQGFQEVVRGLGEGFAYCEIEEEQAGKNEFNRESAQDYILKNLRGSYEIADSKERSKESYQP